LLKARSCDEFSSVCASSPPSAAGPALRVSTEEYFTCADLANGTVQCFGLNDRGQLGSGATVTATPVPQTVGGGMALHGVSTGSEHACALDPSGAAFCWGINNRAQLGNGGGGVDSSVPVAVSPAADGNTTYRAIAAGGEHTCAIGTNNHIYCWGDNAWGQQGNHFGPGNLTPNLAIDP
jgi:alpha-tubulin suppressor-like RCC1 family protein